MPRNPGLSDTILSGLPPFQSAECPDSSAGKMPALPGTFHGKLTLAPPLRRVHAEVVGPLGSGGDVRSRSGSAGVLAGLFAEPPPVSPVFRSCGSYYYSAGSSQAAKVSGRFNGSTLQRFNDFRCDSAALSVLRFDGVVTATNPSAKGSRRLVG